MNTIAIRARSSLRCYLLEAKYELLRLLRTPSFAMPTLVFPPMFYLLFGVLLNGGHGHAVATHMLAGYAVFGVMAPGLFGFGVGIAMDRDRGLLTYKRALPVPPGAMLIARMAMAMVFAAIISVVLAILALTLGGVILSPIQWLALFAVNVLGVLPFCALGLFIGSVVAGQGAPAVINLIYLPMAFLSGLWIPLAMLPALIGKLAPLWPAYHLGRIALHAVGQDQGGSVAGHVIALMGMTAVFFALARWRLARA